ARAVQTGELRLLRTTDISGGTIAWKTVPGCSEPPPDIEKFRVKRGDIFVSRAGSVGTSILVDSDPPDAVFASYLIRLRPLPVVMPRYLRWFLQSSSFWRQVRD